MDLLAIHAYLRASVSTWREIERIGPFLASFSTRSTNPFLNYAIPDDGAMPGDDDVAGLIAAYERRDLRPRLEYLPDLAPAVEPSLVAAGFVVEGRLALMEPIGTDRPAAVPEGIELVPPSTDEELRGLRSVQHEAYDEPGAPTDEDVVSLRRGLESGGGAILARTTDDRTPVGAGEFTPIIGGVSEITSIGVIPPYRRRGIAAAMCARLSAEVRARGATTPFLMANDAESRVYARVGFVTRGAVLHISRDVSR
jgi:GNAT superfamily N-acetyltransferase